MQNRGSVHEFLSSTVDSFLARRGFATGRDRDMTRSPTPSPRKRRKLDRKEDFMLAEMESFSELSTLSLHDEEDIHERPLGDIFTCTVCHFVVIRDNLLTPSLFQTERASETVWIDSKTGERFVVDLRTGNSHRQAEERPVNQDSEHVNPYPFRRTLARQHKDSTVSKFGIKTPTVPNWLQNALEVAPVTSPWLNMVVTDQLYLYRLIEYTPHLKARFRICKTPQVWILKLQFPAPMGTTAKPGTTPYLSTLRQVC